MILIIDGNYNEKIGYMVGVLIEEFESSDIIGFVTTNVENFGEYESGSFYKREMKGIEKIINKLNKDELDCIVIDGYASFKHSEYKALGERLHEKYYIPIIGVAKKKNEFCNIEDTEVFRGKSKSPLLVTCVGCGHRNAKRCIEKMYGENRIPYAIKLADSIARKNKIQLF